MSGRRQAGIAGSRSEVTGVGEDEPEGGQGFEPHALIAALRRKTMPPAHQAEAYRRLLAWAGSIDRLSIEMGLTSETVRQRLAILANPVLGPAFADGRLTWAEAQRLARLPIGAVAPLVEQLGERRRAGGPMRPAERERLLAAAAAAAAEREEEARRAAAIPLALLRHPDRTPAEEADAYASLAALGVRPAWVAEQLGISRPTASRLLRAYADPRTKEAILAGTLTLKQARAQASPATGDPLRVARHLRRVVEGDLRSIGSHAGNREVAAELLMARDLLDAALAARASAPDRPPRE